jgi:hypothetical protein
MLKKCFMVLLLVFIMSPELAAASPKYFNRASCRSWIGAYKGKISASDSVSGEDVIVDVIVSEQGMSFGEENSSFDASSVRNICSDHKLTGIAEIGAGGKGRISMALSKGHDGIIYFRLYHYQAGDGPNFAEFLPSDDTKISLRKVR